MKDSDNITLKATNYCVEDILNDKLCQPQTDCAFHFLVSLHNKYKSRSVDDAVMLYFSKRMADAILLEFQSGNSFTGDEPNTIDDLISYSIEGYKNKFLYLLAFYQLSFIDRNQKADNGPTDTQTNRETENINYTTTCAATYYEIFNWNNFDRSTENARVEIEKYNKPNKNICFSVIDQLTYLNPFFNDEESPDRVAGLDNMLTAFVRYNLYRHATLHNFYHEHSELTAEIYSDIYASNLYKQFAASGISLNNFKNDETGDDLTVAE